MRSLFFCLFVAILFSCQDNRSKNIKPGVLRFYETYFLSEISNSYHEAVEKSRTRDTVKNSDSEISLSSQFVKGLSDYVFPINDYCIGWVKMNDVKKVDAILTRADIKALFPQDLKFMWSASPERISYQKHERVYLLYAIKEPKNNNPFGEKNDIAAASTGYDVNSGNITIDIKMTEKGEVRWEEMTMNNQSRIIAITMDNVVYSAPRVLQAISGGNTQISGSFTKEEAENLVDRINANCKN
jgi:SecD/SecF fusion protein